MAFPTIKYDASGGSDTLASGSDAPSTAVTSVTSSITISTATSTTQTFSAQVNLTGVLDDDTDAIWINTPSGDRHLFRITSFTGGVSACTAIVTTEAATGTGGTLDWAVGGYRKTLENDTSNDDHNDYGAGWTAEFKVGTYSINREITIDGDTTDGYVTFQAEAGAASKPIIQAASGELIAGGMFYLSVFVKIVGIDIDANGANTTDVYCVRDPSRCLFIDVDMYGASDTNIAALTLTNAAGEGTNFYRCIFRDSYNGAQGGYRVRGSFFGCKFKDNSNDGYKYDQSDPHTFLDFIQCEFTGNGTHGYEANSSQGAPVAFFNCVFDDNTFDGIFMNAISAAASVSIVNCISSNNDRYGINVPLQPHHFRLNFNNAFYSNTSGPRNNWEVGTDDVTLSVDPFTDSANDDYSLNSTAGGGADLRGLGAVGDTTQDGSRDTFFDIGSRQHEDPAGGGGLPQFGTRMRTI